MIKSFDIFGESIGFTADGRSTYGSFLGAICSLAIVIITLSYAAQRLEVMFAYGDTVFQVTEEAIEYT